MNSKNFKSMQTRTKQSKLATDRNIARRLVAEEWLKEKDRVEQQAIAGISAAGMMILHDDFGFTNEQLVKFMQRLNEQFLLVCDKFVKTSDFINFCKSEFDIEFKL